jgi:hypothetical protein
LKPASVAEEHINAPDNTTMEQLIACMAWAAGLLAATEGGEAEEGDGAKGDRGGFGDFSG